MIAVSDHGMRANISSASVFCAATASTHHVFHCDKRRTYPAAAASSSPFPRSETTAGGCRLGRMMAPPLTGGFPGLRGSVDAGTTRVPREADPCCASDGSTSPASSCPAQSRRVLLLATAAVDDDTYDAPLPAERVTRPLTRLAADVDELLVARQVGVGPLSLGGSLSGRLHSNVPRCNAATGPRGPLRGPPRQTRWVWRDSRGTRDVRAFPALAGLALSAPPAPVLIVQRASVNTSTRG